MSSFKREKGAAFIEFTLIFPILFLLFLGVIDLCGWLKTHLLLSRVAYEGARYAAVVPTLQSVNDDRVMIRLGNIISEINDGKTRISGQGYGVSKVNDNLIEVTVEANHVFMFLPIQLLGSNSKVKAKAHTAYLLADV